MKTTHTKEDFKPHIMYDPKTGKAYQAQTYEQHMNMKQKGYGHAKPASKPSTKSSTKKKAKKIIRKRSGY